MNRKNIIQILVILILMIWFAVYFYQHIDDFRRLRIVNTIYFVPLFFLSILFLINNGLILKYLLDPFGIKLKFKEWFGLSVVTTMGNYITPFRGGAIARAGYLKNTHRFSYSYFMSTLTGIYIIVFFVNSFIGLLTMILLYYFHGFFNVFLFITFLVMFLFLSSVVIFSPQIKATKYGYINKFISVLNGWYLIRSNKKTILATCLISLVNIAIIVLMMFLEFKVIGINIPILSVLFLSMVSTLSLFISITPGALGIREMIIAFTATVIDIPIAEALTVSVLDRIIGLIIIFIFGPIFSYILLNNSDKKS
jgi:uncharacterized protein (TIRG00374 family)